MTLADDETATRHAVIAANRFGLGARPGDLPRIAAAPRRWLLDQLAGPDPLPAEIHDAEPSHKVLRDVLALRREDRAMRRKDPDAKRRYGRRVREHYASQVLARYRLATATGQPFRERLVHFWSNHFAVSMDKQPIAAIAGLYENEAIRPRVDGNFASLLRAAVGHPAMILYLDNQRSIGPNSNVGRRRNRKTGLNENLAREVLELHTLGVDGGYGQNDVESFARVLTGWSVGDDRRRRDGGHPGAFHFRDAVHEPGSQVVLGTRYPQPGIRQGEAVLDDLARHPSTARHLATRLARHFVAGEPPSALIDRMAAAYLDSGGELPALYRALIESAEPWAQLQARYKSPQDFLVSAWRAFDYQPKNARAVIAMFDELGQAPYRPGSPAGWPDTDEAWGSADALYKRIEWANSAARRIGRRIDPLSTGDAVLGPSFGAATRQAVARAESVVQGTTLLLSSPDFQRR